MPTESPRLGEVIDIHIDGLGLDGRGVGRWNGLVVFVPGAVPGDVVKARIEGLDRRFATAELRSIERASPDRVEPPCAAAGSCGGCQLLHLAYPAQLEWKTAFVRESARRIGGLSEVVVKPCLGARNRSHYRNKAQFPVVVGPGRRGGGGSLRAGLYRRGSHEIIPVDDCHLQHPVNNRILAAAVRLAGEFGLRAYDEDAGTGELRHVLARVSRDGKEAMAVFVTTRREFPAGRRLAGALRRAVPEVRTIVHNINTRRTNVILGPRHTVLSGPGYISDRLGGLVFRLSASSFFQVNPEQTEVLYAEVARMAAGARRVADVYSGVGAITLYLAHRLESIREIVGLEASREAVRDAGANARANAGRRGVSRAGFIHGDAAVTLREMVEHGVSLDTVVLDPPRKGCAPEVLEALVDLACERIVYVSCNPATLARDLGRLTAGGYRPREIQPVDMFPQTAHVECCALLTGPETASRAGERRRGPTRRRQ